MIYRMKQNAAGLASICVLSTMVLVMVSTTVCLYSGMEDLLRSRFPRNIVAEGKNISSQQAEDIDSVIEKEISKSGASSRDVIKYRYMGFTTLQKGDTFIVPEDTENVSINSMSQLICIPVEDYNRIENKNETLEDNQVLVYAPNGKFKSDTLKLGDMEMTIKQRLKSFSIGNGEMAILEKTYYVIVPDAETVNKMYSALAGSQGDMGNLTYYYGFDTDAKDKEQIALAKSIDSSIEKLNINMSVEAAESSRDTFYSLYGGLLFLGTFLGLLFIMATVLIIYYKQISEGFDDRERFIIMQQVGMSRDEVKKSIHSQVLTVFFLPLVMATIHIAFAFKFITKMLKVLYLTNVTLFAWCTLGTIVVFGIFYAIVYAMTARVYYKLVS
jgi:putative ABC transport system permease protein